jgi:hypothetical protein
VRRSCVSIWNGPLWQLGVLPRQEGNVDNEWDRLVEPLGSPEDGDTRQRVVDLMASGWEVEAVLFRTGRWTFRRPRRHADVAASGPATTG